MPKPNTLVETVPAFVGADPLHPVLSDDLSRLTLISEDWCFDMRNPECYVGGVLPAVGAAIPAGGLISLAAGTNPVLNRALNITATPDDTTKLPTFDGKGIVFDGGVNAVRLTIKKTGQTNGQVSHPGTEGDVPFLTLISYKNGGSPTLHNRGPYFAGQYSGSLWDGTIQSSNESGTTGSVVQTNGGVRVSNMWPGVWTHYASLVFNLDRANNQFDFRAWVNGELHASATDYVGTWLFTAVGQGGAGIGAGQGTWVGTVARVRRIYMNPLWAAALTDAQKVALAAQIVADDYAYGLETGLF